MVKILQIGALSCCASASDVDSSSLLQGRRMVASGTLRSCKDDPSCTPLETQCCKDWFDDGNSCEAHRMQKLHTIQCTPHCVETECCEPKPFCGDDGQPACPHLHRNKEFFENIQCNDRACETEECCTKESCDEWLDGGVCPTFHLTKGDLSTLLCAGCTSHDDAEAACCEPTCKSILENGVCPVSHVPTKSLMTACSNCDEDAAVQECCRPATCEDRLDNGVCPEQHLAKGKLATLLAPDSSSVVGDCCQPTCEYILEGGQCPSTHVASKSLNTACPNCDQAAAVDECCRQALCSDRLDLGACPDKFSVKGALSDVCSECNSQEEALAQCCEPFPQCPACAAHEVQNHADGYQCQGPTCGDDECCTATCKSVIGQCPSTHVETQSLQTECPNCSNDQAVEQCCAPATCGDTLNKPCDEIPNHDWEEGKSSDSLCIVGELPCNKAESFHECCTTVQSQPNIQPQNMRYCTVHGDPHIRTFDNKDLTTQVPNPNHLAFQTGKKWLVNHERVKIQGYFIGANGASTLGGLAIKVDDVFVRVLNPPSVRVNGHSTWDSDILTLLEGSDANLNNLGYTAYQTWGHQTIQDGGNSNWHKLYIRFPLFKDEDAERSYVEVYVQGQTNHLDAAIFMMDKANFAARGMSDAISGLCGDNNGHHQNEWQSPNSMLTPAIINVNSADDLFEHIAENPMPWPLVPQCSSSERATFAGLCDACLGTDVPNRDDAVFDCTNDRCAGEPSPEVYMDCEFLNSLR